MDYQKLLKGKIDYESLTPEDVKKTLAGNFAGDIISKLGSGPVESLKECIDDIHELIKERRELHKNLMKEMEMVEMDINNFLGKQQLDMPKEELILFKEKSIELAETKRQELLNCWRDIARLKEELRGYTKEINERQSRMSMLDSILS